MVFCLFQVTLETAQMFPKFAYNTAYSSKNNSYSSRYEEYRARLSIPEIKHRAKGYINGHMG